MTLPKAQVLHIPISHYILKQTCKKQVIKYCSLSNQKIIYTPKPVSNYIK